ncbi:MAPEG family protein [uncultured Roseobacter sp.]|uniref:MAPEG family protein n=1 Tax=uncultured Roseobacter sp. TaxID=114847 RepID=UPI0026064ABD|nr:MAPEG family protein [uncultured Roseobacter sp.]
MWTALVVVKQITGSSGALAYCASPAMSASRIFYLSLYAFGIKPFRSLSWACF